MLGRGNGSGISAWQTITGVAGSPTPAAAQPTLPAAPPTPSTALPADDGAPTEAEVKAVLDRILDHFVRSTPYRVIDTATGRPITDFAQPIRTAGIDTRAGEFNDWTYSMGVVLAGMLQVSEATGEGRYQDYAFRNFDFIFSRLPYFKRQAQAFGPQDQGLGHLIAMQALDDCCAMGAALIQAQAVRPDPRYQEGIDLAAEQVLRRQLRLPDGTLARSRPVPIALWVDDFYMSVPFLARLGATTGAPSYFDDAARQVIGLSARLFDPATGLFAHAWFGEEGSGARFHWGRGNGWAMMAMAELLTVLPESHPDRAKVVEIFRRAARGAAELQSGSGLWHQLLDRPDSYLETSASAMLTFAIARGVNRGWLPPSYGPVAQSGWRGVARRVRSDGRIDGICVATTAASDAAYYYQRPTDLAAMQGYGPTLLAGAEVLTMLRNFEVQRTNGAYLYRRHRP